MDTMHFDDGQDMFALPVPDTLEPQADDKFVGAVVPLVGICVFTFITIGLGAGIWALVYLIKYFC
jgi:hypothetical protein